MTTRPILQGVRVLDLTRVVAGPWCTQTLGDLGAEVIKIERPRLGDDTRRVGPYVGTPTERGGDSAFFLGNNRNKLSATIDISKPAGQKLIAELLEHCDVVVENYKVGDLKRYGLDYETVRQRRPDVIYCSITGFGQDGPYAERVAYDSVLQAMCGLMSTCGLPDDQPGGGPMRAAVPIADIFTGLYATVAVLAAIIDRRATGRSHYIDMSMMDATTAVMGHLALSYLMTGEVPQRQGNDNPITAPSEVFRGQDGYFSMSAGNNSQFAALLEILELPKALLEDARFKNNPDRIAHRKELHEVLEAQTVRRPVKAWIDALSVRGVPCAPINDMRQLFDDPHVKHRDLHLKVRHGSGADVPTLRSPLRISGTHTRYDAAPMLGEHTHLVLASLLGKTPDALRQLVSNGIIDPPPDSAEDDSLPIAAH